MPPGTLEIEGRLAPTKGRESRTQSIATRFTRKAEANGQNLREWVREVLLGEVKSENSCFDLVCEVVGLQLLLMNVLAPMARGEKITADQFQSIVKSVHSAKVKAAEEMFSRRRQPKEE
jgi:hypothetical protein